MFRTAIGAFDALLAGNAARGTIAKDTIARRIWTSRTSAKASAAPWQQKALMSQLRTLRTTAARPNLARLRTPVFRAKRPFHSTRPRRTDAKPKTEGAVDEASLSLSGRLKKLSREYGWAAVGIYLALSVLDFPFCFLLVRTVGTEKIGTLRTNFECH